MSDHYEALGVEPDATRDEIRDAYRAKVAGLDKTLANPKARNRQSVREKKAAVNRAWTVLADPYQRERYDATFAEASAEEGGDDDTDEGAGAKDDAPAPRHKASFRERMRAGGQGGRADPGPDAAPVMKRLGAAMMDVIVMGAFIVAVWSFTIAVTEELTAAVSFATAIAMVVFLGIYNVVPVVRTGRTLGHRLMGLKVVREEDGGMLDRSRALRRYAVPVVLVGMGNPFQMVALLLGLSFMFSQTRLSLLDRLAKSRVVIAGSRE